MSNHSTATRLPVEFVRKPTQALKRKTRSKARDRNNFLRLPFLANRNSKTDARHWSVPATGGYFGGYETGEAMALLFLKYLRDRNNSAPDSPLAFIVQSFAIRFEQEGGAAMERMPSPEQSSGYKSIRGQYVGFFNTLNGWLAASVQNMGTNLDRLTEQDLMRRANIGLGFDDDAYMASLSDDE